MPASRSAYCLLIAVAGAVQSGQLVADEPSARPLPLPGSREPEEGAFVITQTLGGRQFWGDVQFFHDWRIQRHVFTGHYRLLDGNNRRHASGTLVECRRKLDHIREVKQLPPMKGRAVILLHGIFRSAQSVRWLGRQVAGDEFLPIAMDYPSTQISIAASAEYLHSVISQLEGIDEIHLVAHSLGGLVVRAYLAEYADPRLRRLVMIGTPNQGAEMADLLQGNWLYRGLFGPAGRELARDPQGLIPTLPTPTFEFAVIAGARGQPEGWNRLIPGDDDGTVTVESTKLVGAVDFATVPALHTFLIGDPQVADMTKRFLREGRLRAKGPPQPIVTEPAAPETQAPVDPAKPRSAPSSTLP